MTVMSIARAPWLVALTLTLASSATGCIAEEEEDTAESAEAITDGRIVVKVGAPGAATGKWGYDLKQDGRSKSMTRPLAKEIFSKTEGIGMPLVRIAVRASDGHPERGVEKITRSAYKEDLEALDMIQEKRSDVEVFASLKLLGEKTFPAWVMDGGDVNAGTYAVLLENFLAFMKAEGVTVDFLGVDNERKYNKGGITPAKYNTIVADVTAWCKGNGVKVPGFIAPEDYGPEEDSAWLQGLKQTPAKLERVDKVGVHIYSKHRTGAYVDAMHRLANESGGKRLWDSEFHWNDLDKDGDVRFDDIQKGMLSAFDHFDAGFQSMTWWAFQPRSRGTKAAFIMSELVESTIGADILPTDDSDGKVPAGNKLNSRAFKTGPKEVVVWVANFEGRNRKDLKTDLKNQDIASASWVQWSSTGPIAGKSGSAKVAAKNRSVFSMDYPENTITRIKVTLK